MENQNASKSQEDQFFLAEEDVVCEGYKTCDYQNKEERKSGWKEMLGTFFTLLIMLACFAVIRLYVMQPFVVKGASMHPNFSNGDYLIVDELSYHFGEPQRGDVMIFRFPDDPKEYYIKRLIGLPGETVEIKDNRVKIINSQHPEGFLLDESIYLPGDFVTNGNSVTLLKEDEFYVLGDNRMASSDSRKWGVLERKYIIGRVFLRALPMDQFKIFNSTSY